MCIAANYLVQFIVICLFLVKMGCKLKNAMQFYYLQLLYQKSYSNLVVTVCSFAVVLLSYVVVTYLLQQQWRLIM